MSSPASPTPGLSDEAVAWLARYASALGQPAPSPADIETLLALAGHAAHASHRQAAPVSCWMAARAGFSPAEALALARALSESASD